MDFQPNNNSIKNGVKIAKRAAKGIAIAVIACILIFGSTYQIKEQEQAVLITFGKAKAVTDSGLHFKIPLLQQVRKVDTTIQGFTIGYNAETNETIEEEAVMITSDYNFINADFFVEYKISDPVKALYESQQPQKILKNLSQSCIRTVIGSYDVDSVLTTGKNEIQATIKEMILEKLEEQDIGIQLVNVTIQDSEPPTTEIMEAFKAVETAKQGKETALNNANKYRNEKLPNAQAESDKIIKDAEAYKQERINEATGQVARFNAMYEEYIKNPTVTKQRMFYESMEDILPELNIVIDSSNGVQKVLPLEPFVTMQGVVSDSTETNKADTSTTEDTNQ
jgi:modulator of FtsH protease HflK